MNSYDPRYMMLQEEKLKRIITKQQTVTSVAQELNTSRQTIHKWLSRYKRYGIQGLITKRKKRKSTPYNRTPKELEILVENVAQEYWQDGVETLHDRLEYEYNITLHPTTIYRILKRNDIRYTNNYQQTKKRWKKQLFAHTTPGRELQMDTKYPYGYKEGKVIYTIIDDASRWVFAWSYEKANKVNTIDFLEKVFKRTPFTIQKIRTDNGKEFIANCVKDILKQRDIEFRNNTPYCPEENGKIERFHKTLNEKGLRYGFKASDSLDQMQYRLNLFLHYYNYQKKHRGLGMNGVTPMEKLEEKASVNVTLQCYIG